MNRYNWYYRQKVTEQDMDGLQDRIEQAIQNIHKDLFTFGWISGGAISPGSGVKVTVAAAKGYDEYGQRIEWTSAQTIDLTAQKPATSGQSRWVLLAGRFKRALSDPRTDGNGQQVYFIEDESFEIVQRAGTPAASPTKPAKQAGDVILGYVKVAYGISGFVSGDIDMSDKETQAAHNASMIAIADAGGKIAATNVEDALQEHFGVGGGTHPNVVANGNAGFMSGADKAKLDGLNNYSHPTGDGNLHVPATGTSNNGKVLRAGASAGSLSWAALTASDVGAAPTSHTHTKANITDFAHSHGAGDLPAASTSAAGIVQLNSATNSTSTTQAATPSAVKAAYDLANHSHPYASNPVPVTQLKKAQGSATYQEVITIHQYAFASPLISGSNAGDIVLSFGNKSSDTGSMNRTWYRSTDRGATASYTMATWDYLTASGEPEVWVQVDPSGNIVAMWEAEDPADREFPGVPPMVTMEGCKIVLVEAPTETHIERLMEIEAQHDIPPDWAERSRYSGLMMMTQEDTNPVIAIRQAAFAADMVDRGLEVPEDIREVFGGISDPQKRYWRLQLWVRAVSRVMKNHVPRTLIPLYTDMFRVDLKTGQLEFK